MQFDQLNDATSSRCSAAQRPHGRLRRARRSWAGRIVLGFLVRVAQDAPTIIAFLDELRARGFVEGQNVTIVPGRFQVSPTWCAQCHHARPPEGDLDNSDYGRAKDREAAGAPAPQSGHL
jgi:hypothetical protein